jgi:hypothetical protein
MNFTVKNKSNDEILFAGTKQECMHFIKCRKYNRQEISIQELDAEPAYHTTIPVVEETPPPKPFFKRIFGRE